MSTGQLRSSSTIAVVAMDLSLTPRNRTFTLPDYSLGHHIGRRLYLQCSLSSMRKDHRHCRSFSCSTCTNCCLKVDAYHERASQNPALDAHHTSAPSPILSLNTVLGIPRKDADKDVKKPTCGWIAGAHRLTSQAVGLTPLWNYEDVMTPHGKDILVICMLQSCQSGKYFPFLKPENDSSKAIMPLDWLSAQARDIVTGLNTYVRSAIVPVSTPLVPQQASIANASFVISWSYRCGFYD